MINKSPRHLRHENGDLTGLFIVYIQYVSDDFDKFIFGPHGGSFQELQGVVKTVPPFLHDGIEEFLLIFEIVVDKPVRHIGFFGDVGHPGVGVPLPAEYL